jgi:serine/threonine protein phosphatase PrpC
VFFFFFSVRGLKKAKKVMTHGKGKARFEMQDTHVCHVPFGGAEGSGLFCVFDGHAGKGCATLCLTLLPGALLPLIAGCGEGSREKQLAQAFAETDKGLLKLKQLFCLFVVLLFSHQQM